MLEDAIAGCGIVMQLELETALASQRPGRAEPLLQSLGDTAPISESSVRAYDYLELYCRTIQVIGSRYLWTPARTTNGLLREEPQPKKPCSNRIFLLLRHTYTTVPA